MLSIIATAVVSFVGGMQARNRIYSTNNPVDANIDQIHTSMRYIQQAVKEGNAGQNLEYKMDKLYADFYDEYDTIMVLATGAGEQEDFVSEKPEKDDSKKEKSKGSADESQYKKVSITKLNQIMDKISNSLIYDRIKLRKKYKDRSVQVRGRVTQLTSSSFGLYSQDKGRVSVVWYSNGKATDVLKQNEVVTVYGAITSISDTQCYIAIQKLKKE